MKEKVIQFARHPLITGSTIIFIGSFLANIFNLLFNLILGRFLMPPDYGIYSSLISLMALFGIFPSAFTSIFAKFAATYIARKKGGNLSALIASGLRIVLIISTCIFLALLLGVFSIASFLHIQDVRLLLFIYATIFISILFSLPNGVLQGEMRFYLLSFLNLLSPFLKIVLGLLLLFLGLKVLGVIMALFLSSIIPFVFLLFLFLQKYKKPTEKEFDKSGFLKEFKDYSLKFFLATLGVTILTTTDIMFVKHFFSAHEAGQYAALSLMGKSIFYLTSPIYFVFFPLIAHKKEKKESLYSTLFLATGLIALCSVTLSFIYFIFPHIILNIFFPAKEYVILSSYLGPFSLYIIIFSIAILFNSFLLSIGKSEVYKINLAVSLLFIFLIYMFHNSFYQIIAVLFFTSLLLLTLYLIYYVSTTHAKK